MARASCREERATHWRASPVRRTAEGAVCASAGSGTATTLDSRPQVTKYYHFGSLDPLGVHGKQGAWYVPAAAQPA